MADNNEGTNATSIDDLKEVIEQAKAFGIDLTLDELQKESRSEETQKKLGFAFKKQKERERELTKQIEELKQRAQTPPPAPAPVGSETQDFDRVLGDLTLQARKNLGRLADNKDALTLEVGRLWGEFMRQLQVAQEAPAKAQRVLEEVMEDASFSFLSKTDREEIGKRLSGFDAMTRADPNRVRREIQVYIGENFSRFSKVRPATTTDDDSSAGASAAAASQARRGGVRPPDSTTTPPPTPATDKELEEMKRAGILDVALYRAAKARSKSYTR